MVEMNKQLKSAMTTLAVAAMFFGIGFSSVSRADTPVFENLTTDDYKNVVRDISSAWSYTSVSGASSLGRLFGFEVGLVAGGGDSPKIHDLSKQADSNLDISELPSAGVYGALSIPFGLTAEIE